MMAAAANAGGKNKNKPVSTVEPFQRQLHSTGAVPKGEDLHNSINKNHHGQQQQQQYHDEKDVAKYQTLPFGSNVRYNNNSLQNKKDLQNVRFSEAPASAADYQRSYLPTDHQGNYATGNENNNVGKSSGHKPMNSVAPVVMQASSQSRDSSPDDLSVPGKPKPALPPKPVMVQDRNGSVSPPPYIPAPPPMSSSSSSSTTVDTSPESVNAAITILRGGKRYADGQHPSEEGTSVDDDMPSEEDDEHSGGNSGLTVMPNVHISINRRIEMPPAFHFPENQPPPSDLLSGHQVG